MNVNTTFYCRDLAFYVLTISLITACQSTTQQDSIGSFNAENDPTLEKLTRHNRGAIPCVTTLEGEYSAIATENKVLVYKLDWRERQTNCEIYVEGSPEEAIATANAECTSADMNCALVAVGNERQYWVNEYFWYAYKYDFVSPKGYESYDEWAKSKEVVEKIDTVYYASRKVGKSLCTDFLQNYLGYEIATKAFDYGANEDGAKDATCFEANSIERVIQYCKENRDFCVLYATGNLSNPEIVRYRQEEMHLSLIKERNDEERRRYLNSPEYKAWRAEEDARIDARMRAERRHREEALAQRKAAQQRNLQLLQGISNILGAQQEAQRKIDQAKADGAAAAANATVAAPTAPGATSASSSSTGYSSSTSSSSQHSNSGYTASPPPNEGWCLSVEPGTDGFTTTVTNRCSKALKFTFCWGFGTCQTSTGASSIAADGKTSVGRSDKVSAGRFLVYAAAKDTHYKDYLAGVEAYFTGKKCTGNSCGY